MSAPRPGPGSNKRQRPLFDTSSMLTSTLLPVLEDLLPLFLPSSVSVTRAHDVLPPFEYHIDRSDPRVQVFSRDAVVKQSDKICTSILILKPTTSSTIRHHGEQDTIIYVVSGFGLLLSQPKSGEDLDRRQIGPGDFAYIPAWMEHQFQNTSDQADLHLVIIRSGGAPVEVSLTDWGGSRLDPEE